MFLRSNKRFKDGKEHRYWSIVENRRLRKDETAQRTVLYLGEINDSQQEAWQRSLDIFDEDNQETRQIKLFPDDRAINPIDIDSIQVKLSEMELQRPRSFGDCWLGCLLWNQLELDKFWNEHLPEGREKVRWSKVLELLTINRLIDPGSEWKIHRHWFDTSAMDELLGEDFVLAEKNRLYRCLDQLLKHKEELFLHLQNRWKDLFGIDHEVLLYDLTSTYFEGEMEEYDKAKHGYSRDGRSDCRQVVIALIVTKEGFPLAYEVMPGNTSDKTTLKHFLKKIETQYGQAKRIWLMDRGVPTEEVLNEMKNSNPPVYYLVGTPRSRLNELENKFIELPWDKVRDSVEVKMISEKNEVYVLAKSIGREAKERAMRKSKLKKLWKTLQKIIKHKNLKRDDLLLRLGAAKKEAGRIFRVIDIILPKEGKADSAGTFKFSLNKDKLRKMRKREGRYLLRTNLNGENPSHLWQYYIQLTEIEAAFKCLKSDLAIRPIFHKLPHRIEAHIFVAFIAYCLMVTLKKRLSSHAPGLTPRAVLEKFSEMQMIDVHLPTSDNRHLIMPRYTQPEKELALLIEKLNLKLPKQPPPRIYSKNKKLFCGGDLEKNSVDLQ
jgi:transposase